MKLVRQLLESLILAFAAAVVSVVFHYFGGFTFPESIVLAGCFTIVALWVHGTYKIATFKPYSVQIFVNFEALREDLGMVKCSDPIDRKETPHELYNFSAISAVLFVHYREYVFRTANELNLSGRNTRTDDEYRSAIQFGDTIPGVFKFSTDLGNPKTMMFRFPRFIFSRGWTGFELKVQVVPEWWSEYKRFLSPEVQNLPLDYDGFMVLARLPYGYFPDHVQRFDLPTSLFYPFDIMHRRWRSKLSEHGWTVREPDEEISSRYLIVRYQSIWPPS